MATTPASGLDALHHVALSVQDIPTAVNWYRSHFACEVRYQDETWALLQFANMQMALVIPSQHPPHISFTSPDAARFGELRPHRDGTRSVYIQDPSGNTVEVMDASSL